MEHSPKLGFHNKIRRVSFTGTRENRNIYELFKMSAHAIVKQKGKEDAWHRMGRIKIKDLFAWGAPEVIAIGDYESTVPEEQIKVRARCKTISEREAIIKAFNGVHRKSEI